MELSTLPEHVVVETTEHKCLQSQFSVLYNEAMQLKTQLEEARNQLQVIILKSTFSFCCPCSRLLLGYFQCMSSRNQQKQQNKKGD